jgi:adenylate cyclase
MATARTRIRCRQLAAIALVVCALAPVFNVLTSEASLRSAIQGVVDGFLITLLVGGYLLFVRDGRLRPWFRRLGFRADLALSSAIVLALFLVGRAAGLAAMSGSPERFLTSFTERHLIYAVPFFAVVAVSVQFVVQMNRMIGANVLGYFVAGVYHQPKAEERIFLFLDLEGSTQLAERLGSARYFELLRRFVDDLSEPVLETGGEIYQYAGDEVVITWASAAGLRAANCVRCFFGIREAVARRAARYEQDFGVAASAAAYTAVPSPAGSWATSCGKSSSSATSSTRPPVSRSTPSGRVSTSSPPARCSSGSRFRRASRRRGAESSRCGARRRAWPPTASP